MDPNAKIKDFSQRIHKDFPDARIILFGSRARGDALVYSDYDVMIISEAFKEIGWIKRIETLVHYWVFDDDILPYTPSECIEKQKTSSTIRGALKQKTIEV
ncbi:MAG: nucleotidyltransferase domain-containing protein [Candidatus Woesearchaeota archaeon]